MESSSKQSVSQLAEVYSDRFEKHLLSLDEAIIDAGKKTETQKLIEASEQHDNRRLLLVVEELAIKKKEVAATAENAYLQQVETDFNQSLIPKLEIEFKNTSMIIEKVLRIDASLGRLLDVLYTEACSISRLIKCIEPLPWLEQSILKFVRQPKYTRTDSSGRPIVLKTLRSALSFIGIESLRTLLPVLVAKHANPLHNELTPNLMKHLWVYTVGLGNVAKALSDSYGIKPHFGFNIGLLSNIGRTAVVNIYLRVFEASLSDVIMQARKKNDLNLAHALSTIKPSHTAIIELWKKYASKITSDVINEFNCRWMMIGPGYEDFASIKEMSIQYVNKHELHPYAKLLFMSQGYMQYRILFRDNLMTKQEAMMYLRNYGINSKDVSILKKTNLAKIELNIAGVIDESEEEEK